jgi:hypothetical protein
MTPEQTPPAATWRGWCGLIAAALLAAAFYVLGMRMFSDWDDRGAGATIAGFAFMFVGYLGILGWSHRARLAPKRFLHRIDRSTTLPVLPTVEEVRGALREADRRCVIRTCDAQDERISATGALRRGACTYSLTIERSGAGADATIELSGPRPWFGDDDRWLVFSERLQAALHWRSAEAAVLSTNG